MNSSIYQIKITLKDSKPLIWRRFLVFSDISLYKLHKAIQIIMGWEDYHLHHFEVGRNFYGIPDPDFDDGTINGKGILLKDIVPKIPSQFLYEYDFGDSWDHIILVEKVMNSELKMKHPICIDGKRACPPEDVGGIWGYQHFLKVLGNPKHKEYRDLKEWIGGKFNPEHFNKELVNEILKKIKY